FIVPGAPMSVFGIVFNASKGMVPLVYAVGTVAMIFTALSYMTMSRLYPVAGSAYAYAARAIGPTAGFFAGWALLLDYLLTPALIYIACAIAMHAALPEVPEWIWVTTLLGAATLVNWLGIEATAKVNIVLLILQLVILAVFIVIGIAALAEAKMGAHLASTPLYNPATFTPNVIFGALSLGVLSFLGFDAISTLSEEAKDGPATIGKATILSLCIAGFLFVAQTYLASLFMLGRTSFAHGDAANAAFYDLAQQLGGYWFKFLVTVPGVLFGGIAGALTAQAATARLLYSMARDGKLPRALAHVHAKRKVPERAVFTVAAITLVLGLIMVSRLELITSMVSFGALVGFTLVHVSVLAEFWRRPERQFVRHIAVPLIGMAITLYVLWNAEANAKIAGLSWLAAGVVFFFSLRAMGRSTDLPVEIEAAKEEV